MQIASSQVALESRHASIEQHAVEESLRLWRGDRRPAPDGRDAGVGAAAVVDISEAARTAHSSEAATIEQAGDAAENDPKLQLLLHMIEALTGHKVRLLRAEDLQPDQKSQARPEQAAEARQAAQQQRAGWGLEYDRRETHYEAEQTTFAASGVVRTRDGREIRFDLQLAMRREYRQESSISLRAGDAVRKDPLVINFDGNAAELTDAKFTFDLDADGAEDRISFVAPGSGFLALDRNGDGVINDGTELFGALSGDGFADLARFDLDGNRWIDESDAVYADLRIWTRDAAGNNSLGSLQQYNVGALYLDSVATPFELNTTANHNLGMLRASGIYLAEDGSAGTLQQVDLTV